MDMIPSPSFLPCRSGANAPQSLWVPSAFDGGDPLGSRREDTFSPSKGQLLEVGRAVGGQKRATC